MGFVCVDDIIEDLEESLNPLRLQSKYDVSEPAERPEEENGRVGTDGRDTLECV